MVLAENLAAEFKNEIALSSDTDFLRIMTIALQSLFTSHQPSTKIAIPEKNCPIQFQK